VFQLGKSAMEQLCESEWIANDIGVLAEEFVKAALDAGWAVSYVCVQSEPCSPAVLARIRKGLLDSKHTPHGIKEHCQSLWPELENSVVLPADNPPRKSRES
jgi:hypothetical protein